MVKLVQGDLYEILSQLLTKRHNSKSIDFRVEGVSQDAILQDEAKMKEIKKVGKEENWIRHKNPLVTIYRKVV